LDILKLQPEAVIKPWGLRREGLYRAAGVRAGVGEVWLASGQTGPGTCASRIVEPALGMTLAELLDQAARKGDSALGRLIGPRGMAVLKESPHRGKTEGWAVREARGRVGFVSGPRTAGHLERLRKLVLENAIGPDVNEWTAEVRGLLGVLEPVRTGEAFLVPCGTLHTMFAVGEDSMLVIDEIQQGYGTSLLPTLSKVLLVQGNLLSLQVHPCDETVRRAVTGELKLGHDLEANPTVRVTDFGRRPGEEPALGFDLVRLDAGLRRVAPVEVALDGGARVAVVVACAQFVKSRLTLPAGAATELQPPHGSYRVLHCVHGSACVERGHKNWRIAAGETAFVPAELEAVVRLRAEGECELLDDAVPDLVRLPEFLEEAGASARQIDGLLRPPRAV
jgi:mannose-6-phosphate isomerase-like protein (cupin superfamily)